MSAKWTAFKKEQPPEGHGAIYVTDGTRASFVKRADQAATEVEKWVLAEPEAERLNLTPAVFNPTHWAVDLPGLPTVKEEDIPEIHEGGPPVPQKRNEELKPPVQKTGHDADDDKK